MWTASSPSSASSDEVDLPPPGRVALFFFRAAGEENIAKHSDERGSVVELIGEFVPQQTLRDDDHASDEQCQTRKDPQIVVAVHKSTLVLLNVELLNTEHPPKSTTGAHSAAKQKIVL
jgi:hypothetical protein